jgi:TRAP-type C4-dicarboxylate transport system permease large subunit
MLIVVPVYAPLVMQLGFDPIWFWMMFLVTILFGGITPPFHVRVQGGRTRRADG